MPSPFPGMNPYLEQTEVWQDFHQSFVPHLREMLSPQVRPEYIVKVEEQLFIHEPSDQERFVGRADVSVSESAVIEPGESGSITAPVLGRISLAPDVEKHAFLEIRDRRSRRLITVVEVLSPSNKYRGPDRDQYLAKRRQLFCGQVHLVELDLLRGGPRLPVESLPACDYCVMISRYEDRPQVGLWPIALRDSLPVLPIPLSGADSAELDLQQAVHEVYDAAGYEDYIYETPPEPQLSGPERQWVESLLHEA